jgi:hypothetical protein
MLAKIKQVLYNTDIIFLNKNLSKLKKVLCRIFKACSQQKFLNYVSFLHVSNSLKTGNLVLLHALKNFHQIWYNLYFTIFFTKIIDRSQLEPENKLNSYIKYLFRHQVVVLAWFWIWGDFWNICTCNIRFSSTRCLRKKHYNLRLTSLFLKDCIYA